MHVILFIVLMLPVPVGAMGANPPKPIIHEEPMGSVMECLTEVLRLSLQFEAQRKAGSLQVGCVIEGPEKEAEH